MDLSIYKNYFDLSTECRPVHEILCCPKNEELIDCLLVHKMRLFHTHCGLFHKANTIYGMFYPKSPHFRYKCLQTRFAGLRLFSSLEYKWYWTKNVDTSNCIRAQNIKKFQNQNSNIKPFLAMNQYEDFFYPITASNISLAVSHMENIVLIPK